MKHVLEIIALLIVQFLFAWGYTLSVTGASDGALAIVPVSWCPTLLLAVWGATLVVWVVRRAAGAEREMVRARWLAIGAAVLALLGTSMAGPVFTDQRHWSVEPSLDAAGDFVVLREHRGRYSRLWVARKVRSCVAWVEYELVAGGYPVDALLAPIVVRPRRVRGDPETRLFRLPDRGTTLLVGGGGRVHCVLDGGFEVVPIGDLMEFDPFVLLSDAQRGHDPDVGRLRERIRLRGSTGDAELWTPTEKTLLVAATSENAWVRARAEDLLVAADRALGRTGGEDRR